MESQLSVAQENPLFSFKSGSIEDFLQINRQLPNAVCDENWLSRPPTLSPKNEIETSGGLERGVTFQREFNLSESDWIRFALEDQSVWLTSREILEKYKEGSLIERKRGISLEICKAMITPLPENDSENPSSLPSWALGIERSTANRKLASIQSGQVIVEVRDPQKRYGKLNGKWTVPGWIEYHEWSKAHFGSRSYLRLVNPVTNRIRARVVLNSDQFPVALLGEESSALSWEKRFEHARTEKVRRRHAEIYAFMIETESYEKLLSHGNRGEEVRKIQEFYQNLLRAYQIFPNDSQFRIGDVAISNKTNLESDFQDMVEEIKVGDQKVPWLLLGRDSKLEELYRSFQSRIAEIR